MWHGDGKEEEEATTSGTHSLLTMCQALCSLATLTFLSATSRKYQGYMVKEYHHTIETLI